MHFRSRSKPAIPALSFVLLTLLMAAQSLHAATYQPIEPPNSNESNALGINNHNLIVGWYFDSSGNQHGFLLNSGQYTAIDFPGGGNSTVAYGINDSGVIVGEYQTAPPFIGPPHGWIEQNGTFTQIDYPGAYGTFPIAINRSGEIVGYWWDGGQSYQAFKYVNGKFSAINLPHAVLSFALGIDSRGDISGTYWVPKNGGMAEHGFILHRNGHLQNVKDPAQPDATVLAGINDKLHAAGSYNIPNTSNFNGFVFAGGKFAAVNYPGAVSTQPQAINNSGMVVGTWSNQQAVSAGFMYMP